MFLWIFKESIFKRKRIWRQESSDFLNFYAGKNHVKPSRTFEYKCNILYPRMQFDLIIFTKVF